MLSTQKEANASGLSAVAELQDESELPMSKSKNDKHADEVKEMQAEYDFSKGVRGKHHSEYYDGHTVRVCKPDGTVMEQHFTLEEGAVLLDQDVREYFPDSRSVNEALRSLITLIPKKRRPRTRAKSKT